MSTLTLTKTETRHLLDAAGKGGLLSLPDSLKPASRERLLGRYLRDGLVGVTNDEGMARHRLMPAGYRAVGLRPPRARAAVADGERARPSPGAGKKEQVVDLLRREEGASLAELIEVTGWLPHTTRAALSRLRSAGENLVKAEREDGTTAYRIPSAAAATISGRKRPPASVEAVAAA